MLRYAVCGMESLKRVGGAKVLPCSPRISDARKPVEAARNTIALPLGLQAFEDCGDLLSDRNILSSLSSCLLVRRDQYRKEERRGSLYALHGE